MVSVVSFAERTITPILGRYPTLGHIEGEGAGQFHGPERNMSKVVIRFAERAIAPILGRYPTLGHIEGERAGRFHGPEGIMSEVVVGRVEGVS